MREWSVEGMRGNKRGDFRKKRWERVEERGEKRVGSERGE